MPSHSWFPSTFSLTLWASIGLFLVQALLVTALTSAVEETAALNSAKTDDTLQMDDKMSKRDWSKNLKMWGKRGWSNLNGGWGLKRSIPSSEEDSNLVDEATNDKRAWKSLQGGWGKRLAPTTNDELSLEQLAYYLLDNDKTPVDLLGRSEQYLVNNDDSDIHEYNKRSWDKFNEGWGKRDKWQNFRGSWGKREPAWTNLKGIWGKRSSY